MDTNQDSSDETPLALRPLPGSERTPLSGVVPAAETLDGGEPVTVTLVLRRRAAGEIGAAPADVALVTETLSALGLSVVMADDPSRRVRVSGTVARLSRVFGVELQRVERRLADGRTAGHRQRSGGLSVPAALDGVVIAVLGLDDRPQARAQYRIAAGAATNASYTPPQLGAIYRFPPGADGSGNTVAIIELGGGFAQSELDTYFAGLGVTSPSVTAIGVDGGENQPGQDPQGADGEVLLDIEVAGSLAAGAQFKVYFAPNTDAGFLDAVSEAIHASPAPVAISISWGQSEDEWTGQARTAMDDAFADAVALGITVTAAAGDNGSSDGASRGVHADFPASSPHVLACGGTTLIADPSTATISAETVWNGGASGGATGGGVSDTFPLPDWQSTVGVPAAGRGLPDVSAVADPATGYQVLVDGTRAVYGGTSAVAPLWAALVACLAQATGTRFGLLNAALYDGVSAGTPAPGFRDIVDGSNGAYSAGPGWDPCSGLGTPDGEALLAKLRSAG